MLKLKKIRLQQLEEDRISSFSMNQIMGGSGNCSCGCLYANVPGGSETADNRAANNANDYVSPGYNPKNCVCNRPGTANTAPEQCFWECGRNG